MPPSARARAAAQSGSRSKRSEEGKASLRVPVPPVLPPAGCRSQAGLYSHPRALRCAPVHRDALLGPGRAFAVARGSTSAGAYYAPSASGALCATMRWTLRATRPAMTSVSRSDVSPIILLLLSSGPGCCVSQLTSGTLRPLRILVIQLIVVARQRRVAMKIRGLARSVDAPSRDPS